MAKKVHPRALLSSSSSSAPCYFSSKRETFTIWMKSLVLNGKGCTVFDSDGHIMYRVDNYNTKSNNEVYLMDFDGGVLFTILKKVQLLLLLYITFLHVTTEPKAFNFFFTLILTVCKYMLLILYKFIAEIFQVI